MRRSFASSQTLPSLSHLPEESARSLQESELATLELVWSSGNSSAMELDSLASNLGEAPLWLCDQAE